MARPPKTPLSPGETVLDSWVGGLASKGGRTAKVGGTLHLTTKRLIFEPVQVAAVAKALLGLGIAGGSRSLSFNEWGFTLPLAAVAEVTADPERAATLWLHTTAGKAIPMVLAAGRFTPIWSKKNRAVRDEATEAVQRLVDRPADH